MRPRDARTRRASRRDPRRGGPRPGAAVVCQEGTMRVVRLGLIPNCERCEVAAGRGRQRFMYPMNIVFQYKIGTQVRYNAVDTVAAIEPFTPFAEGRCPQVAVRVAHRHWLAVCTMHTHVHEDRFLLRASTTCSAGMSRCLPMGQRERRKAKPNPCACRWTPYTRYNCRRTWYTQCPVDCHRDATRCGHPTGLLVRSLTW